MQIFSLIEDELAVLVTAKKMLRRHIAVLKPLRDQSSMISISDHDQNVKISRHSSSQVLYACPLAKSERSPLETFHPVFSAHPQVHVAQ